MLKDSCVLEILRIVASGEWKADTAVDRTAEEMNAEMICMMYCYDEQTGRKPKAREE